jgi:hypothetical protein
LATLTLVGSAQAADYYAAPSGSASGAGSLASPWDLQTALSKTSTIRAGDTLWLRDGTYIGCFYSYLSGNSTSPVKVRPYGVERPRLQSGLDGGRSTLAIVGSYIWIQGLEVMNTNTKRTSSQSGSWPTDILYGEGITVHSGVTGLKIINCVIHDNRVGIGMYSGTGNVELYGNLVYYNGWLGPDRHHGHGMYCQNNFPYRKDINHNFSMFNSDHGIQAYSTESADNVHLDGDVFVNNGDLFPGGGGRNMLVQGYISNSVENVAVWRTTLAGSSDFMFGYGLTLQAPIVRNNYVVGTIMFSPMSNPTLTGNTFLGPVSGLSSSAYPQNTYYGTYPAAKPTGAQVLVRPNQYEAGRGNIVIYNWSRANTVNVDISNLGLAVGDQYELHNAVNFYGDIITGTYAGSPISIPMTGRTVAAPAGLTPPASTFPDFGAFVLLKKTGATGNTAPTTSSIASQTINANGSVGPLAFTIGDGQTAAASLTVSASSSTTTLVPNSAIVLGGSGANRTVTVTPAANQSGTATITLTVSDGSLSTSTSFTLTVNSLPVVNTAPTISGIAGQSIYANTSAGPLAFTVGDAQTAAGSLTLTVSSSNATLVPSGGLSLSGSAASRAVTVTPAANQTGSATVTVTVSDGSLSATASFTVTVNSSPIVNTAPTISSVASRSIAANSSTGPIPFTVGDAQTAAGSLVVNVSSSNTALVPSGGLSLGSSGANRTVTVSPATGQTGAATITLTVSDGALSASTSFTLTVTGSSGTGNTPPALSSIADQTIAANGSTLPLAFTVGDTETPVGSLTVTASASDPTLVPSSGIVLGGSGGNRTITITPASNRSGTTSILLIVNDGSDIAAKSFSLAVNEAGGQGQVDGPVYIPLEAEDGNIVAPMQVVSNATASGSAYLMSPTANAGRVTLTVDIPVDGTYIIWCRVLATAYGRDTFNVSVDGGPADVYDMAWYTWSPNWQWSDVNGRGGKTPMTIPQRTFQLSKGTHTITFQARDANSVLDRVIITNDPNTGFGEM